VSSWHSDNTFATGSRDRGILVRDLRTPGQSTSKLTSHLQEVCGLEYSTTYNLASGGNDNKLLIWDMRNNRTNARTPSTPLFISTEHTAAVKAIAWNPATPSVLATGSGTADRHLRFFNLNLAHPSLIKCLDTSSQICGVKWSKDGKGLVTTHGYSENEVRVWNVGDRGSGSGRLEVEMKGSLVGHSMRVLYLAMSPCGENVCTGAGDETLRFWNVFERGLEIGNGHGLMR